MYGPSSTRVNYIRSSNTRVNQFVIWYIKIPSAALLAIRNSLSDVKTTMLPAIVWLAIIADWRPIPISGLEISSDKLNG